MKGRSRLKDLSDDEEARIQDGIASDPDTFAPSDAQLARAKPFAEAFPDLMDSIKRSRGRPPVAKPLQQISIRLDPDVIAKFKSTGKGWQARINTALKRAKV